MSSLKLEQPLEAIQRRGDERNAAPREKFCCSSSHSFRGSFFKTRYSNICTIPSFLVVFIQIPTSLNDTALMASMVFCPSGSAYVYSEEGREGGREVRRKIDVTLLSGLSRQAS